VLESLRLEDGQWARLERHLDRLSRTALHFNFATADTWPATRTALIAQLDALAHSHPQGVFKVRVLLDAHGGIRTEAAPLSDTAEHVQHVRVALANHAMPQADEFILHKTTRRTAYQAFKAPPGCFDTLLYNAQGQITEFTIGNVAVLMDGRWVTPPTSCGLLPGVMRDTLLAEGRLQEAMVTRGDLSRAQGLALLNSVRGWVDVELTR
jgi:para-aminobenzoate synthetase/4-amino-4-deoxychorismate lyase